MITYTDSPKTVTPNQLEGFFVGWPNPPSVETHLQLLGSSSHVVLAIEDDGQVVGFITAISDGVLSAYIPFLEVLPSFQKRGIGAELVRRLLGQLDGLYSIGLHCDPELQPFYEKVGMTTLGGMSSRNYAAQSGRRETKSG